MRASIFLSLWVLLTSLTGCATRQSFMPAQNVSAITRGGYLASHYESKHADGSTTEIEIWSGGTFIGEADGQDAVFAHVGFVLDNASSAPVRLDPNALKLESVRVADGERIGPLSPVEIGGDPNVAAGAKAEIEALFRLPEGVSPTAIRDFQLSWVLTSGRERYAQRTSFERSVAQPLPRAYYVDYPYYFWPNYYPYYYPYVGGRSFLYRSPFYGPSFYGPSFGYGRRYGVPRAR
jgi:hypothetical protein